MSSLITRRRFLASSIGLPLAAITLACSSEIDLADALSEYGTANPPTATPEPPYVMPQGDFETMLMAGTPYETPLYGFGTGSFGPITLVLGGVHGNEPGGWQAAEEAVEEVRPSSGGLIIIPRANRQATYAFVRTTDELGDLNRLYPGDPNGLPMARMAAEIIRTIRENHVSHVIDMHESWAFYKDRPQNGTAYLGQTISTQPSDEAVSLATNLISNVNQRILSSQEEFFFREFPNRSIDPATPAAESQTPVGSSSSLGIPTHVPGVIALLVEMGQQQDLDRRTSLHVEVLQQLMRETGSLV